MRKFFGEKKAPVAAAINLPLAQAVAITILVDRDGTIGIESIGARLDFAATHQILNLARQFLVIEERRQLMAQIGTSGGSASEHNEPPSA